MRKKNGTFGKGTQHPKAKLSAMAVINILHEIKNGVKQDYLAVKYKVTPATICKIGKGQLWPHVFKVFNISSSPKEIKKP